MRKTDQLREKLVTDISVWRGQNAGKERMIKPTWQWHARSEAQNAHVASLEAELAKAKHAARVQHNCVQELHGNVRVYTCLWLLLKNNAAAGDAVVLRQHSKLT